MGGRSTTVEVGGSRAGVQARVADARPAHVQRQHVVDTADREPARVVRRRAVGDVGRVEVAVDGRQDEVDVPVSVGRSPAVRRHAVQREVRLDVHQSVARTERSRPQQPRLRYDTRAHTWSAPSNTTDCVTDGYTHTQTHTQLFNGPLSRTNQVSRYQKVGIVELCYYARA